jgi:hypothetical protein
MRGLEFRENPLQLTAQQMNEVGTILSATNNSHQQSRSTLYFDIQYQQSFILCQDDVYQPQ